ncbi:hypothetical protein LTR66_004182 [Elasticomyces elasticus]|nr:hypothetical protein LTR66_004182 [Elasticomyces elasticus]
MVSPKLGADARASHPRKSSLVNSPPLFIPAHSAPTTFFLKSEKDMLADGTMEEAASEMGQEKHAARDSSTGFEILQDSTYGVQSLEDAIGAALPEPTLSRRLSISSMNSSNATGGASDPDPDPSVLAGRKRKAGNPIHPTIAAMGQRILSSEHHAQRPSSATSPVQVHSSGSPFREYGHLRRGSNVSGAPSLSPLRLSPAPESGLGTPHRPNSVRSFQLSDEEGSLGDETSSQNIQSSSGEEEDEEEVLLESGDGRPDTARLRPGIEDQADSLPELVMPSIAMPARRPFTEKGKRMGRLKIMIVGRRGVGKTSLIKSIVQTCPDIVHVDPPINSTPLIQTPQPKSKHEPDSHIDQPSTARIEEIMASTKAYANWWAEIEENRTFRRRKSIGDAVLERNISFVDTPGIPHSIDFDDLSGGVGEQITQYVEDLLHRNASLGALNDSDLLNILSGSGGCQVDAVLYVLGDHTATYEHMVMRRLSRLTNVIPVIGNADKIIHPHQLSMMKEMVLGLSRNAQFALDGQGPIKLFQFGRGPTTPETSDKPDLSRAAASAVPPFAISSALSNDAETMDASLLMSPDYVQPLVPSELGALVEQLFDPENMAWLRHSAARKFLQWRRERLGNAIDLRRQQLSYPAGPAIDTAAPALTASLPNGSPPFSPSASQVSISSPTSRFFGTPQSGPRSAGPVPASTVSMSGRSTYTVARLQDYTRNSERLANVRLAKWAQDLQRSMDRERQRHEMVRQEDGRGWHLERTHDEEKQAGRDSCRDLVRAPSDVGLRFAENERSCGGGANRQMAKLDSEHRAQRLQQPVSSDTRDPLGFLAFGDRFRRRSWVVLKVLGGAGVAGAIIVWVARTWELGWELDTSWLAPWPVGSGSTPTSRALPSWSPQPEAQGMDLSALGVAADRARRAVDGFFGWQGR